MYRLLWLCYGLLITYGFVVSVQIPEIPDGARGAWWNNECVFANWKSVRNVEYVTNEAVYGYYSGESVIGLREVNAAKFMADYASGRTLRMGLDYYALHYTSSVIPEVLIEDYGRALAMGAVLTVETGIENGRRYMKVVSVDGYR